MTAADDVLALFGIEAPDVRQRAGALLLVETAANMRAITQGLAAAGKHRPTMSRPRRHR